MRCILLLAFLASINASLAARILAVVPVPGRSHAILFERLVIELGKKGHDVTFVTYFPLPKPAANVTEIILPNFRERFGGASQPDLFAMKDMNPLIFHVVMSSMGSLMADECLSSPELQQLINSDQKFDAIINEVFLTESLSAGLAHKFKAALIGYATFMPSVWANHAVGNPSQSASLPDSLLGYSTSMTLMERTKNTLYVFISEIIHSVYHLPMQDRVMRKYFGEDLPPLKDIILNTSLVLVNYNQAFSFPRAYGPNMVEIAGVHIAPPKQLPKDLEKFMNESKEGVILFSMGSNLKSANMNPEKIQIFLNAFSQLKQNVLWKFETESLPEQPKNVKIQKWLPQSDILAHPNLKLFITHGGLLSTTEAIFRGVPIVGIPIFGDQPMNMRQAENAGYGRTLNFDTLTSEVIVETVNEVLNNPRYREVVQQKSALVHDSVMTPLETAIHWIEYVIRHKGAPHFKSPVQNLTWYQYYLLDVAAVVIFSIIAICKTFKFIIKSLVRKCSESEKGNKNKKSLEKKKMM